MSSANGKTDGVVTSVDDPTATRVCDELEEHDADFVRWDVGDFPQRLSLTATIVVVRGDRRR